MADTFVDKDTGLIWQDDISVTTTKKDWNSAIEHCQDLTHAGHNDWRLPTRMELHSITDKSKYDPAVKNGIKNVATSNHDWAISNISNYYWSSSLNVENPGNVWLLNFKYGFDHWASKSDIFLVRCVRDSK